MTYRNVLVVACLSFTTACGSDSPPTSPTPGSGGSGTVTAVVDGVQYTSGTSSGSVTAQNNTTSVVVGSRNAASTSFLSFILGSPSVGTVALSPVTISSFTFFTANGDTTTASWTAAGSPGQGSGTYTIATMTAAGMSGTFAFSAPPTTGGLGYGATGTKVITNGTFNVTF